MRHVRIYVAIITTAVIATVPLAAKADEPAQQATVTGKAVKRPPRVVHRRARLVLPAHPSTAQVQHAIVREATMWGVSAAALSRRVNCESGYHWWATNGQYQGVLQFGSNAFYRGLTSLRTRKVVEVEIKTRSMHSRVYRTWSNGRVTRSDGRAVRQRIVLTRTGWLPRHPSMLDVETQLRIGAQALRGISAVRSSEWSCAA